jgi:hypothetical protein
VLFLLRAVGVMVLGEVSFQRKGMLDQFHYILASHSKILSCK